MDTSVTYVECTYISHLQEWWTYVCMGPADLHPNWHLGMRGTQHRAVMWRAWKEGGTGFLYWGVNCYEKATSPAAEVITSCRKFCEVFHSRRCRHLFSKNNHVQCYFLDSLVVRLHLSSKHLIYWLTVPCAIIDPISPRVASWRWGFILPRGGLQCWCYPACCICTTRTAAKRNAGTIPFLRGVQTSFDELIFRLSTFHALLTEILICRWMICRWVTWILCASLICNHCFVYEQDFEYLHLYSSMFGRPAALSLLEKTGMYHGPERYTHEHGPIESMRGEVYRSYRPITWKTSFEKGQRGTLSPCNIVGLLVASVTWV